MRGRLHSLVEREGFASPISRPRVESPRYAAWPCRARGHLGSTWSAVISLSPPGPVSYIYYITNRGSPDRRPLKSADGRGAAAPPARDTELAAARRREGEAAREPVWRCRLCKLSFGNCVRIYISPSATIRLSHRTPRGGASAAAPPRGGYLISQHGAASRELAVVGATAMWRQSQCMLKLVLTLRTTGFAGAAARRLACLGSAPRHTAAARQRRRQGAAAGGTIAGQSRGGVEGHSSSAGGAVATRGHATRGGVAEGVDEALGEARPRAVSSRSRGGAAAGGGGESEVSRQSGCGGEGNADSAAGSLASLEDATAGVAVAAAGGSAPPDEPRPWTAASTRCWARSAAWMRRQPYRRAVPGWGLNRTGAWPAAQSQCKDLRW